MTNELNAITTEDIEQMYTAANWNVPDDDFTQMFYVQNVRQFWLPDEIPVSDDMTSWDGLTDDEKEAYMKVLAGLTMLDTIQGDDGMPSILRHVEGHQRKAVLSFMAMMENAVHAKSYSTIFMSMANSRQIRDIFNWVHENTYTQRKAHIIRSYYDNITDKKSLYKAMVMSVMLESFLFYSGFYYPLYMYGQGRMMNAGEIINLIIRDEAIHGVYVGLLAQELYNDFDGETQQELYDFTIEAMTTLYENECDYTAHVYDSVGLTHDVKIFVRYNANKALQNLGFDNYFEEERVNPVVLNGLLTSSKSHDFFSQKGGDYLKANVEATTDDDFVF